MSQEFAVQFMWLLIFIAIFVGSLCVLDVLFRPRPRAPRDYRVPHDFKDLQRKVTRNGFKSRMGVKP